MKVTEVIDRLRAYEPELRKKGVKTLVLFGSVARGEAAPSDVDLAAEFERGTTIPDAVNIEYRLSELLNAPVDLSNKKTLKEGIRESAERDFVLVF